MTFDSLLIHPDTLSALERFLSAPAHAVLLEGPRANGKRLIALQLAATLLGADAAHIENHPSFQHLVPVNGALQIEQVRTLATFLTLKVPGKEPIKRVVFIEDADALTLPAQHALLKIIEEPPLDTVLILTSSVPDTLLATIRSRLQHILVRRIERKALEAFLTPYGDAETIEQAITLSDGNVGAAYTQLVETPDGTADIATINGVKSFLKLGLFDQLLSIDTDLKDKATAKQFVHLLSSLAEMSLLQAAAVSARSAVQWKRILQASYTAEKALAANANVKLALTELVLFLR